MTTHHLVRRASELSWSPPVGPLAGSVGLEQWSAVDASTPAALLSPLESQLAPGSTFVRLEYATHVASAYDSPSGACARTLIDAFLDAYGMPADFDVADAVVRRRQSTIEHVRSLADQGVEPQRTWVAEGSLEHEAAEIRWIEENRGLFAR